VLARITDRFGHPEPVWQLRIKQDSVLPAPHIPAYTKTIPLKLAITIECIERNSPVAIV
jgi:hypothetical protein